MREREQPMTQSMKATDARAQFSKLLNQVFRRERRVLVEKDGIPVAAIVSADDLVQIQRLDAQRARDFAILDEIGEAFKDEPSEVVEREVAKALAAVRNTRRAKRPSYAPHE